MTEGLLKAFWAYEHALMADDLAAMDHLFAPGDTLRGDTTGLLVGHDEIAAYRWAREASDPSVVPHSHGGLQPGTH